MAQPGGGFSVTSTFWQYANVPIVPLYLRGELCQIFSYLSAESFKELLSSKRRGAYFVRVAIRLGSNDCRKRSVLVLLGML